MPYSVSICVKLLATRRLNEGFELAHKRLKTFQRELLRSVAPRFGRIRVDFDQQLNDAPIPHKPYH
jgi:hypothetical protein